MDYPHRFRALAVTVAVFLGSWASPVEAQAPAGAIYSALAVDAGAMPGQTAFNVDVNITRWSTPEEREAIITTLMENPTKLLEVLQKMPVVGRLTSPGSVGWELRYATISQTGGTDRIVLLTDRPMGFAETASRSRTTQYPFTVIEMRVPPNGDGEGRIMVAAQIAVNRTSRSLMIEDYNIAPVQLRAVKKLK
jgi:hypothetical protein